jgi:hypothetical protein
MWQGSEVGGGEATAADPSPVGRLKCQDAKLQGFRLKDELDSLRMADVSEV